MGTTVGIYCCFITEVFLLSQLGCYFGKWPGSKNTQCGAQWNDFSGAQRNVFHCAPLYMFAVPMAPAEYIEWNLSVSGISLYIYTCICNVLGYVCGSGIPLPVLAVGFGIGVQTLLTPTLAWKPVALRWTHGAGVLICPYSKQFECFKYNVGLP